MSERTTGYVATEGCDIYYERRGAGPPLLLITGGHGDAGYYDRTADALASTFTVVTYDRRGNSRSGFQDSPVDLDMDRQAQDAAELLQTVVDSPAPVRPDPAARFPRAGTAGV